jgi:uncharacterized protein YegP (UPF0339 family)
MATHIEVAKGKRRWFWRLVSKNGQTVLTSEQYYSKYNALRSARRLAEANGLPLKIV